MDPKLLSTILSQNKQREELTLGELACPSSRGRRLRAEKGSQGDIRGSFSKDTDRIIHCPSYSRSIDKTQVFPLTLNDHITHRVLHVQLVAKVGRQIGRALKLNEDLIEAIALGHDLGHPPYGSLGEHCLNEICQDQEGGFFTHNAQSFRTLLNIENAGRGLNLTLQVLDGILCHNKGTLEEVFFPGPPKTFENLLEEYHRCISEKDFSRTLRPMTFEGCVVQVAHILAYVGRDLEDAVTLELLPRESLPEGVDKLLGNRNDKILQTLSYDLIEESYGKRGLAFSPPIAQALQEMMTFNSQNIHTRGFASGEEKKIPFMFRFLYKELNKELKTKGSPSFIRRWAYEKMHGDYRKNTPPLRIVMDYLAGMTDRYFNQEFQRRVIPKELGFKFPQEPKDWN